MKFIALIATVAASSLCGYSHAENDGEYSEVISIGGNGVTIRNTESNWFFGVNVALQESESDVAGADDNYSLSGLVGHRVYLNNKKLRSFVDGTVDISHGFSDLEYNSYQFSAVYGIEAFISREVSLEGAVGVSLFHYDGDNYNSTSVSAPVGRFSMSYYFN